MLYAYVRTETPRKWDQVLKYILCLCLKESCRIEIGNISCTSSWLHFQNFAYCGFIELNSWFVLSSLSRSLTIAQMRRHILGWFWIEKMFLIQLSWFNRPWSPTHSTLDLNLPFLTWFPLLLIKSFFSIHISLLLYFMDQLLLNGENLDIMNCLNIR